MSDLIDRNNAVEAIEFEKVYMTAYKGNSNGYVSEGNPFTQYNKGLDDAIKAINNLAPAEPERTAKVRDKKDDPMVDEWHHGRCMNCGKQVRRKNNYCSRCGAKLEWNYE